MTGLFPAGSEKREEREEQRGKGKKGGRRKREM